MKATIYLDIEKAKEYMANAKDKKVEDLPLWVALSICMDMYLSQKEEKDEKTGYVD